MTDESSCIAVPAQENSAGEGHPVAASSEGRVGSSDPMGVSAPVVPFQSDTSIQGVQPEEVDEWAFQEPELFFLRSEVFYDFLDITRPYVLVNDPSATQR